MKKNSNENKKPNLAKGGTVIGIEGSAYVGGGIGLGTGIVITDNGEVAPYFTFTGGVGFGSSFEFKVERVQPTKNADFTTDHYDGTGNNILAGFGGLGYSTGGSNTPAHQGGLTGLDKFNVNKMGTIGPNPYKTYSKGIGTGSAPVQLKYGGSISFTESRTWVGNKW